MLFLSFLNKEGVELFQIGKDKTGFSSYDTLYIKEDNDVAVSSGLDGKHYITLIDIESKKVITTILFKNVTINFSQHENTILPSGSKEHPLISSPFVFTFCFRFNHLDLMVNSL
jgi:hypothetical protein